MGNNLKKFIQVNSPDGGFLQSEEWRKFQESVGRKTFSISTDGFWVNIIEHNLSIVGKYFYCPRGPVVEIKNSKIQDGMDKLIALAEKENAGWVRIEMATQEILKYMITWTSNVQAHSGHPMSLKIVKAPHDVQPREIFVIDITKSEEELLSEMKSKTRYNIKLAEKKGVKINLISNSPNKISNKQNEKYISEFLRLVRVTAKRDGIVAHPEEYYRKMLETIPGENLKLYVAEYEGKVIVANLVSFHGDTCTYMHGASDNENRNVMAPFLLQWRQIQDAKFAGCVKYDFGGVSSKKKQWIGITKFKTGFSPKTNPVEFPGSYDIIINRKAYFLYRVLQKIKSIF